MNKVEYKNIIEPVVNRNNCILWGLEVLRGKRRNTLRIYIDSSNVVDISDCENISKDLSYEPMLDVSLGDDYILEVSSPGVDRKFFNIEQLNDYLGEELEFKTKELIDGKRKFNGILSECDENYFYVKQGNKDKNIIKFKFNDLDLCKLKPNYNKLIKEYSNAK
jgi:ribosome maturation factor RimP